MMKEVWSHPGVHFHVATVSERNGYGEGSVVVCGGFGMDHRPFLRHIQENVTGIGFKMS